MDGNEIEMSLVFHDRVDPQERVAGRGVRETEAGEVRARRSDPRHATSPRADHGRRENQGDIRLLRDDRIC